MKLVFRQYVERELDEAANWYEEHEPGLREKFLNAVGEALARIEENPRSFPVVHLDIRRAAVRRFPYGVFYALIQGEAHAPCGRGLDRPSSGEGGVRPRAAIAARGDFGV